MRSFFINPSLSSIERKHRQDHPAGQQEKPSGRPSKLSKMPAPERPPRQLLPHAPQFAPFLPRKPEPRRNSPRNSAAPATPPPLSAAPTRCEPDPRRRRTENSAPASRRKIAKVRGISPIEAARPLSNKTQLMQARSPQKDAPSAAAFTPRGFNR